VSERGPAINQRLLQIQNEASIKEVWGFILGFFVFLVAVFPGLSLVLDPRGRLGGLGRKAGSSCKEFEGSNRVI